MVPVKIKDLIIKNEEAVESLQLLLDEIVEMIKEEEKTSTVIKTGVEKN